MTSPPTPTDSGQSQPAPSRLDKVEQGAKIFATAAIPVIVAFGGWIIQTTIEGDKERAAKIQREQQNAVDKDKISLEYVKIAKDILASTEKDIPPELTAWSWKLLDGVSPIKFDEDDLKRLIARKERIPAPSVPSSPFGFPSLAPEYEQMFKNMGPVARSETVDAVIESITANKARYSGVEKSTGVPWFVVAILHYMDSSLDFRRYLGNGDPLNAPTVSVPAGRGPFSSWEDGARDTLQLERMGDVQNWSIARILFELEKSNGFGYRRHQINTPYLWNCTPHYAKGQYVGDGRFDPEAVAPKCGGAVLLKRLMDRQLVTLK
jgi:lysozyme family protein